MTLLAIRILSEIIPWTLQNNTMKCSKIILEIYHKVIYNPISKMILRILLYHKNQQNSLKLISTTTMKNEIKVDFYQ